jgi:hypothetical protein
MQSMHVFVLAFNGFRIPHKSPNRNKPVCIQDAMCATIAAHTAMPCVSCDGFNLNLASRAHRKCWHSAVCNGTRNLIGDSRTFSVSRKFWYDILSRDMETFTKALKATVVGVEIEVEKQVPGAPSTFDRIGGVDTLWGWSR